MTYKVAGLLALATGQRVQTLAAIDINNIRVLEDKIEIKITKRLKTSGKNKAQPTLILPFYTEDVNICPARTIQDYIAKTQTIRGDCDQLLITFKRPFHSASAQTISRWIKTLLTKSGIDTSHFTAHSTRHASTSAAARKGISYDTIRLAAGWSEKSKTFANFYQRPLIPNKDFAQSVLSTNSTNHAR